MAPSDDVASCLRVRRGELTLGGVSCRRLADRFGTPLYVSDAGQILRNYARLEQAFGSSGGRVRILYAVKANPSLAILNLLRRAGAGADVSSPGEIVLARAAGFRARDMLYTPSFPSSRDVAFAQRAGLVLNLDLPERIPRPRTVDAVLSLRVNPGFGRGGHRGTVTGGKGAKFGIPRERIVPAFRHARRLGYRRFGLHTMTGSGVSDATHFVRVVRALARIAGEVRRGAGVTPEFLDVGGGFGIPYRPGERPLDLDRLAARMQRAFDEACARERLGRPQLWIEPGRFLVGDAGILLTRVTGIRKGEETFVGVDAGLSTFLRPALYGAYHTVLPVRGPGRRALGRVTLTGPVCENTDILAKDRPMPDLRVDDLLAVLNAGAYGHSMGSNYNGSVRPPEVLVHHGRAVLVREGETPRDLLRRQRMLP